MEPELAQPSPSGDHPAQPTHQPSHPPSARPCPQRAKTDAFEGLEWDNPERPEARNLLTIYQCVTGE